MFEESFLKKQKVALLKQQADLEKQLKTLRSKKRRGFPFRVRFPRLGTDVDSDVQEVEEYEGNLGLERQLSDQLRDTKYALSMMRRDRYGKCLACGKEIEVERLKTLPSALTHANHTRPVRFWERINLWPILKKKISKKVGKNVKK